jgi:hypothetical protein
MTEPTPAPANNVPAIVRTIVPVVVGAVISWLITRGLDLSSYENAINAWLLVAVTTLYYALFKWLESKWPAFGWFLGLAKQPVYVDPKSGNAVFAADKLDPGLAGGEPPAAQ